MEAKIHKNIEQHFTEFEECLLIVRIAAQANIFDGSINQESVLPFGGVLVLDHLVPLQPRIPNSVRTGPLKTATGHRILISPKPTLRASNPRRMALMSPVSKISLKTSMWGSTQNYPSPSYTVVILDSKWAFNLRQGLSSLASCKKRRKSFLLSITIK